MTMTKSVTSNNDCTMIQLDDADLDTVVGGASEQDDFNKFLAAHSVGGWVMQDVFAKPVLGRYTPQ
jgi:hypothetical protein